MQNNYRAVIDIDIQSKLSANALNSIKNQIKSIGPINIPVNITGAGSNSAAGLNNVINNIGNSIKGMGNSAKNSTSSVNNLFNTTAKGAKNTAQSIKTASQEMEFFGKQAAATVRRFTAFVLVVSTFNNLTRAIAGSFDRAVDFEKEITKVSQVTGTAYSQLKSLTTEITRLSTTLGVGSDKIAKTALTLAQAGLTAEETKKALDVLAKTELSATFDNLNDTTEASIAIMAQFKVKAEELARPLGAISGVSAKFAVESADLATAIRRTGGAFQATGGDLNELLALFTSVRATTRESAESISTGLRTIFTRLQRTRTLNFLDDLGISLRETDKQGRSSFIGIYRSIEKLSAALKDIPGNDPRFNQIIEELGGFRQVSKVIPLLKEFDLSQKALNVARRAGNTIDKDAITAQKTLANQMARVGQEFDALIRKYLDDQAVRRFITLTLDLASALIKVGDSIRPLAPLLTTLAATSLFRTAGSVAKGFAPKIHSNVQQFGKGLGFSNGGFVPGAGNGDTQPAMLEPGEFVVKKSAVQAFGAGNLAHINKYANGGRIRPLKFSNYIENLKAKRFLNPNGILQFGNDFTVGKLNDGELDAVMKYTNKGNNIVNRNLNNKDAQSTPGFNSQSLISNITSAIRKGKINKNTILYRGIRKDSLNDIESQIGTSIDSPDAVGKIFTQSNFSSTSTNPAAAKRFGGVFKVLVKAGSRGLNVPTIGGSLSEAEVLLQRGSRFRVVKPHPDFTVQKLATGGLVKNLLSGIRYAFSEKALGIDPKNRWSGSGNFGSLAYPPFGGPLTGSIRSRFLPDRIAVPGMARATPSIDTSKGVVTGNNVRAILAQIQKEQGIRFDDDLVSRILITSNPGKTLTDAATQITGSSGIRGAFTRSTKEITLVRQNIKDIDILTRTLLHELGHAVDAKIGGGKTYASHDRKQSQIQYLLKKYKTTQEPVLRSLFSGKKLDYHLSNHELIANSIRDFLLKEYTSHPAVFRGILGQVSTPRRYATGGFVPGYGHGDSQPALLTPGEFVVNKQSAQAIGYGNLGKINKYAGGGKVSLGAVGLGLSVGPSIAEQFIGDSGPFKALLAGVTVAGAALTAFSFLVKRSNEDAEHQILVRGEEIDEIRKSIALKESEEQQLRIRINHGTTPNLGGAAPNLSQDAKAATQERLNNLEEQKRLSEQLSEANDQILKEKETIAKNDRTNRITQNVAIGAAVAAAVGTSLSLIAEQSAARGQRTTFGGLPTTTAAGVGGALSGAATGGLVASSIFPHPLAIAGGALLGGAFGAFNSANSANQAIQQFELGKSVGELNKVLNDIDSGKTTVGVQRGFIRQRLGEFNTKFENSSPEEIQNLRSTLEGSLTGVEELFSEAAKAADSLDDFRKANKDLILALSRFGGQTIVELEKQAEDLIKNQKTQNQIIKEATQNAFQLENIFKLTGAVADAERAIHGFQNSLESLDSIISGNFGATTFGANFSALNDIGNSRLSDVRHQALLAGNLIGGPAVGLAKDVSEAALLSGKVPGLLAKSINGNQLEGDDIRDLFRKELGHGFAANLIVESLNKETGSTVSTTELIKKFGEDPVGLAKRIQASLDPLTDVLKDAGPKIEAQFDALTEGLAKVRKNNIEILSQKNTIDDIRQLREEINAGANNRVLGADAALVSDRSKLSRVVGGRSPQQLGDILATATGNIELVRAARARSTNRDEIVKLTKEIENQNGIAEEATNALEYLADVTNRLAAVERERQKLQQTRANQSNLAKEFVFGDPSAQRDIVKGLLGVRTILGNLESGKANPLEGLSKELKELSLSILEQFSSDKLFQGKTGQEIINEVIAKRLGVNLNQPAGKEAQLLEQSNKIITDAEEARAKLAELLSKNNNLFLTKLNASFDLFLAELGKAIGERENKAKENLNLEKEAHIGRLDNQIGTLKLIGKLTNLNPNDPKSIDATRGVIDSVKNARAADVKALQIDAAKHHYLKTGDTSRLEKVLGPDYVKEIAAEHKRITHAQGFVPGGLERVRSELIGRFIDQKVLEQQQKATDILVEAQKNIGKPINGIIQNLEALEKGLEAITEKKGLKDFEKEKTSTGRATGGMIWNRRGSDTVPAMTTDGRPYMLSPGEFIMSKKAVHKYGLGFMKKVNYAASGNFITDFYGKGPGNQTIQPPLEDLPPGITRGNTIDFPYKYNGIKYASLRAALLAKEGKMGTNNPLILASRKARGVRPDGSSYQRNVLPNLDVQERRNGEIQEGRALYQRLYKENLKRGMSPNEARKNAMLGTKYPINNPFPMAPKPQQNGGTPPSAQPQGPVSPKVVEEFNNAVNKLAGSKLELSISGTVDVRIIEGNISKNVEQLFSTAVQAYVDNKVTEAINNFASQNGLPSVPKPTGVKTGEKK